MGNAVTDIRKEIFLLLQATDKSKYIGSPTSTDAALYQRLPGGLKTDFHDK
jgi:hypothetical protein